MADEQTQDTQTPDANWLPVMNWQLACKCSKSSWPLRRISRCVLPPICRTSAAVPSRM